MPDFAVKVVNLGQGERIPLLVRKSTAIGIFDAATYALELRDRGLTLKTLDAAMRSLQLLYEELDAQGILLDTRAQNNELLKQSEVDAIAHRCKTRLDAFQDKVVDITSLAKIRNKRRVFAHSKKDAVKNKTCALRLHYIIDFLTSFSRRARQLDSVTDKSKFADSSELTIAYLKKKKPPTSIFSKRRGMSHQAEQRLLEVTHPMYPQNPWSTEYLRYRNYLEIKLFLGLGIRKGELCGIKLDDVSLRQATIFIAKRSDDEDDERNRPATTKTLPRILPLNDELINLLQHYINEVRSTRRLAEYSPYLILSDEGNALAMNGVDYMFASIRDAYPEFVQLSAHVLRHTTNDRFAENSKGKEPALVQQCQNYLMGWSKNSKTSETYTKAYVEEQARQMLMARQERLFT